MAAALLYPIGHAPNRSQVSVRVRRRRQTPSGSAEDVRQASWVRPARIRQFPAVPGKSKAQRTGAINGNRSDGRLFVSKKTRKNEEGRGCPGVRRRDRASGNGRARTAPAPEGLGLFNTGLSERACRRGMHRRIRTDAMAPCGNLWSVFYCPDDAKQDVDKSTRSW